MGELRPWHIIILVVVVFVLFGYKKLPDATRSLGRSLRILKTEVKSLHEDEAAETPAPAEPKAAVAPRAVEAPRVAVPEAGARPAPPVAAAPAATASDADHR